MSDDQKLIVEINTILNKSEENPQKYRDLKEELRCYNTLSPTIMKHIIKLLSDYNQNMLPKALHLLDYLSSICAEKLQPLLEDEDFLEKLSFLVWEPRFKPKILSLIKFWSIFFEKKKIDCPKLNVLLSNLKSFDIDLPEDLFLLYCNEKGDNPSTDQAVNDKEEKSKTNALYDDSWVGNSSLNNSSDVNTIMHVINVHQSILEMDTPAFTVLPKAIQQEKVNYYADQIKDALNRLQPIMNDYTDENYPDVSSHLWELISLLEQRQTKLEQLQAANPQQESQQESNDMPVYGPHYNPDFGSQYGQQYALKYGPNSYESSYEPSPSKRARTLKEANKNPAKGLLDDIDGRGVEKTVIDLEETPDVMQASEFLKYKVDKCPKDSDCPYLPARRDKKVFRNESLLCPYFHSIVDKRRPLYSDHKSSDQYLYGPKPCRYNACNSNHCQFTNNFFEQMFHPINYKRYKCDDETRPACTAKKYCPYYHDLKEKQQWNSILSQSFKIQRVGVKTSDLQEVPKEIELFNDNSWTNTNSTGISDADSHKNKGNSHDNYGYYPSKFRKNMSNHNQYQQVYVPKPSYINVIEEFTVAKEFINPATIGDFQLSNIIACPDKDPKREEHLKSIIKFGWDPNSGIIENYEEKYNTTKAIIAKQFNLLPTNK